MTIVEDARVTHAGTNARTAGADAPPAAPPGITGGAGTRADTHAAAALDPIGGLLGTKEFPATAAGYAALLGWLRSFGTVTLAGVEGTGSYGAGLARHLATAGVRVAASPGGLVGPLGLCGRRAGGGLAADAAGGVGHAVARGEAVVAGGAGAGC